MESLLQSAARLAAQNFYVFPLCPRSKLPAIEDFPNQASRDPERLAQWWKTNPQYNIGISTSRYAESEALLAIDIDTKKKGDEALVQLELEGRFFPDTFEQETPTRGRHLVYRVKESLKQGTDVLARGLDTRSRGGYLVGAGSILENGAYRATERPVREAPEWLISECGRSRKKHKDAGKPMAGVEPERSASRATRYLLKEAPLAVEGESGDQTTFKVAARVKDLGVDAAGCLELLLDHWNERCLPPWSREDLSRKVENAYAYGGSPIGVEAPEAEFGEIEEETLHPIERLNSEYAYIGGSRGFILQETTDVAGNFKLEVLDVAKFHQNLATRKMQLGDGKWTPISKVWMTDIRRREYRGLCFLPGKEVPKDFYNLWRGFAVEPAKKLVKNRALDSFLEHAEKNVCNGSAELAHWLIGYFAHMIQRPWEKPNVALAMRGKKGVGKTVLLERVGALLGGCYSSISNREQMTGRFNAILENKILLVLEEAWWAGDKAAEGVLKTLITGEKHLIERKGQESYEITNCLRIAILGNEDWIVPATEDERRYAVFEVGESRIQDFRFFDEMRKGMEAGGYAILLRYLLDFDLSGVNVTRAPKTEGLLAQKVETLSPFHQWWLHSLSEGTLVEADFEGGWPRTISTSRFRDAFVRYVRSRQISGRIPAELVFGKQLKKFLPSVERSRPRQEGERIQSYDLPSLAQARAEWDVFIGGKTKWENDDSSESDPEGLFE